MDEEPHKNLNTLTFEDWAELQDIYNEIVNFKGPFYEQAVGETGEDGVLNLPYYVNAPIVLKTEAFFYNKKLIVSFDWSAWDEGKELFSKTGEAKFDNVSAEDALKLFTAISRANRFNEGQMGRLFASGDARLLLKRLLSFKPNVSKK